MINEFFTFKYNGCKFKKRLLFNKGEIKIHRFGVTIITGKNGTGKSTLLKKIYRNINNGGVFVAQENEEIFSNLTVLQNITFNQTGIIEKELKSLIDKYKLNGVLEKNCNTLSGGEKRLISLLRGIFATDEIIFMDEPTNDLDYRIIDILKKIISEYMCKKTFIIVTHDERMMELATTVYKIEEKEVKIDYNKKIFGQETELAHKSKYIADSHEFIKKVLPSDISNLLAILVITVISFCFFLSILGRMNFSIERIDNNQVEVCNTLHKPAEELLREGFIPTYLISYINQDISPNELEEKIQNIINSSERELYSLSLNIDKTDNYNVYTLEYFDLQNGIHYYVLDDYINNTLDVDSEKYYIDTSEYFIINNNIDNNIDNKEKTPINFEYDKYKDTIDTLTKNSQNELEQCFIILKLSDKYDFDKLVSNKELSDFWEANYFIRSNETIYWVETAIRMNGYKDMIKMWAIALAILLIISVIGVILHMYTLNKPIRIIANYGIGKSEIMNMISNRCIDKKKIVLLVFIANVSMLIILLINSNGVDIRECLIPSVYTMVVTIIVILQKVLIKRMINKIFSVEGEFEC